MWYYTYTYYIWASEEMGTIHSQNGGYLLRVELTIVCLTEAHDRENAKFMWVSDIVCLFGKANIWKSILSPWIDC